MPGKGLRDIYGAVYFVGPESHGHIKIGFSSDRSIKSRLSQLQTGSYVKYVIHGFVLGSSRSEKAIHNLLARHHVTGEWFTRDAALALLNVLTFDKTKQSVDTVRTTQDLALSIGAIRDSIDEHNPSNLANRVAVNLLSDWVIFLLTRNVPIKLPFRAWLDIQRLRDDPIGDLACNAEHDESFPDIGTLDEYLIHILHNWSYREGLTRTVIESWTECQNKLQCFISSLEES